MSEAVDTAIVKARYMAKQYKSGSYARSGNVPREHYLETLANEIEKLYREKADILAAVRRGDYSYIESAYLDYDDNGNPPAPEKRHE